MATDRKRKRESVRRGMESGEIVVATAKLGKFAAMRAEFAGNSLRESDAGRPPAGL